MAKPGPGIDRSNQKTNKNNDSVFLIFLQGPVDDEGFNFSAS